MRGARAVARAATEMRSKGPSSTAEVDRPRRDPACVRLYSRQMAVSGWLASLGHTHVFAVKSQFCNRGSGRNGTQPRRCSGRWA
jgi:hypothetical protein